MHSVVDRQLVELATKIDTLELTNKNGKALGTGWVEKAIDQFCVDIYQIRDARRSTYIETPVKFKNPKYGLVHIQNEDDECFRWCMLYRQSQKEK